MNYPTGYSHRGVDQLLPPVRVRGVRVLPAEVLGHLPRGELRLADGVEVPGQVNGFTCNHDTHTLSTEFEKRCDEGIQVSL